MQSSLLTLQLSLSKSHLPKTRLLCLSVLLFSVLACKIITIITVTISPFTISPFSTLTIHIYTDTMIVCFCRNATNGLSLCRLLFPTSNVFLTPSNIHPSLTSFDKNLRLKGFMRCVKMVWTLQVPGSGNVFSSISVTRGRGCDICSPLSLESSQPLWLNKHDVTSERVSWSLVKELQSSGLSSRLCILVYSVIIPNDLLKWPPHSKDPP